MITVGPALGHGSIVDETSLEQILACALQYKDGIKVKIDHAGGFGDIIGFISNFRIETDRVRGDLQLIESHPMFDTVLNIIKAMPDQVGLSITYSGIDEEKDGIRRVRCDEIFSIDLVDQPAANPNGMFHMKDNQTTVDSPSTIKMKFDEFVMTAKRVFGISDEEHTKVFYCFF